MRLLACLLVVWPSLGSARVVARSLPAGRAAGHARPPMLPAAPSPALDPSLRAPIPEPAPSLAPAAAPSLPAPAAVVPAAAAPLAAPADAPAPAAPAADAAPGGGAKKDEALDLFFDGSAPMRRPLLESWEVKGRVYASTRELLREFPLKEGRKSVSATYRYSHEPPRPLDRAAYAAVGSAAGAAVGLAVGVVTALLADGVKPLLSFMRSGAVDWLEGYAGFVGVSALVGAVLGLIVAAVESASAEDGLERLGGRIRLRAGPGGVAPVFEVKRGEEKAAVDLRAHAFAVPMERPAPPRRQGRLRSALVGAAAGALLALSQVLLLPLLAGPFLGAGVGRLLARGRLVPAQTLGGGLGLLVTAGAFVTFAAAGEVGFLAAFAAFAAAMSVVGALVGVLAWDLWREDEALEKALNPPDQWWAGRLNARPADGRSSGSARRRRGAPGSRRARR